MAAPKGWRYIATRLNGDGTETALDYNVPLTDAKVSTDLSGPGQITGNITPEVSRLQSGGRPLFLEWSTALYAECDGLIRGGGIIADMSEDGPALAITAPGWTAYPKEQPYTGSYSQIGVDPLNVVRHIWAHLQSKPGGNIGLSIDDTTSPIRLGTKANPDDSETGPYELAPWKTLDLGTELDNLADSTPFDYRIDHAWAPGDTISHNLVIGYPRLGARKNGLRFVVGENVFTAPGLAYGGNSYASGALIVGAGEGRDMIAQVAEQTPDRLRRIAVIEDKTITSKAKALAAAETESKLRSGLADFAQDLVVIEHRNAPVGSYTVGDEIPVTTAKKGWTNGQTIWVRILSITLDPPTGGSILTVIRAEKVV